MTSFKKIKSERKDKEINQIFFKAEGQNVNEKFCNSALDMFNSINRYHSSLSGNNIYRPMKIKDCYTLILAEAIINNISTGNIVAGKGNSLPEDFYLGLAETLPRDDGDSELVVINLKQLANIMKSGGVILFDKGSVFISDHFRERDRLYLRLLEAFWNETEWSEIFPSSPDAAEKLFRNRNVFADLLQGFYTSVSVEDIANDFFDMTDIAERNDYFMISFLDFYLISWLRNFGILEYTGNGVNEIIYLSISDYGREILRKLV